MDAKAESTIGKTVCYHITFFSVIVAPPPSRPPEGVVRNNSNKLFYNNISCTAEVITPPPLFYGTVFNITSPISFGRNLSEVLLNLSPPHKKNNRVSASAALQYKRPG
jgi:hypothetical protein